MHKRERKGLFVQNYIASMGQVAKACLATKIGHSTYYNWLDPKCKEYDADFVEAIKLADLSFCEACEEVVWKKIRDGSDLWLWRYLRNHNPKRWKNDRGEDEENLTGTIKLEITRKVI